MDITRSDDSILQSSNSCSSAEALKRAEYLDQHLERTGTPIGPLHGLPISLKDCFITPPHPASIGMACFAEQPTTSERETLLVTVLRDLGAVFYCKTNVPVAMMMMESINNVWGETRNPYHTGLSAGGSSGGEAALIAMRGSPLGVGTDIGGSIRIPSAWTNLYGLKASSWRFPTWAIQTGIPGNDFVPAVNGPMARELDTVRLYCEAVLSDTVRVWEKDPKCLPIPWRKGVLQPKGRKLRVGVVGRDDGCVTCHPPVERALNITRRALDEAGHEVIDWWATTSGAQWQITLANRQPFRLPTDHGEIARALVKSFHDLGGSSIIPLLRKTGEPIFEQMKAYEEVFDAGESSLDSAKLRQMNMERNQFQKAYLDRWQATAVDGKGPLDAIIMASTPWAASKLGATQKSGYVGYTGVWNLLGMSFRSARLGTWPKHADCTPDFSVCTFPVTFADRSLDRARTPGSWKPLNDLDKLVQADYDADFHHGAPVALQLVGRRLEEEKVLEMVEVVADLLGKRND
ncbi:vitamin d3 hydroxylase-associated protein [Lasallia pustulata]|uniref:amidase n=1 Tax=Lasallia pustulata TaxID=136370 RepID=A0A1W5D001_9LECA|nr:vitamin d3 hydroxylase-associated protein [Lasallia pustulata]